MPGVKKVVHVDKNAKKLLNVLANPKFGMVVLIADPRRPDDEVELTFMLHNDDVERLGSISAADWAKLFED